MGDVLELFRRAIDTDDAMAMGDGLQLLFSGAGGRSASDEFEPRDGLVQSGSTPRGERERSVRRTLGASKTR
jgi:hypothetical protein